MSSRIQFLPSLRSDAVFALRSLQLNGKEAPTEFPLLMPGTWKGYRDTSGKQQTINITASDIQAAYEFNQLRKQRNPQRDLVLDYEHQTLTGEEAPAAAWFDLSIRDGVLYATNVRWINRAKQMVESGEYRYVSPVFKHNALDKESGNRIQMAVFNAALTNEPFLDELPPLIMKGSDVQLFQFTNTKGDQMNPLMQFLISFFAMAAGTTEDAVVAKSKEYFNRFKDFGVTFKDEASMTAENFFTQVKTQFEDLKKFKENYKVVAAALGETEDASHEKLVSAIAARLDTSNLVLKSEYEALKSRMNAGDADSLIAKALAKGKISHRTKDVFRALALKSPAEFNDLMAKTPEFSAMPREEVNQHIVNPIEGLTEMDLTIAKGLGRDGDERFLKSLASTSNELASRRSPRRANAALTDLDVEIAKATGVRVADLVKQKDVDELIARGKQSGKISDSSEVMWRQFADSDFAACKAQIESMR